MIRQPKWKTVRKRFARIKKELAAAAPKPAPIERDEKDLCRECKRRGVKKNCGRCQKNAEQRERVRIALQSER